MRKSILLLTIIFVAITSNAQSVGIGTATPDSSSQLEVHSKNKGFLPPRVALDSLDLASPIVKPAPGLLVYNTADTNNVIPGYYYWNDSSWYPVVNKGKAFGDMQYWDGSKWIEIPIGSNGQVLTVCNGIPTWGACSGIITLAPIDNQYEGLINVFSPTAWLAPYSQLAIEAWTDGGQPFIMRSCLKFDYSSIPSGVTIDSATLYLYSDPNPINGDKVDAQEGTSDAFYIQRITSNWVLPTPFTWNSPPSSTTTNEVLVPQSTSSNENDTTDVTALVKDMVTNSNNGFYMLLQNEVTYNIRQYASSYTSNPLLVPKLVISYHK